MKGVEVRSEAQPGRDSQGSFTKVRGGRLHVTGDSSELQLPGKAESESSSFREGHSKLILRPFEDRFVKKIYYSSGPHPLS